MTKSTVKPFILLLAPVAPVLLVGCVSPRQPDSFYPLAVRHVPTANEKRDAVAAERAFASIRALGCNAVMIDDPESEEAKKRLHSVAVRSGLRVLPSSNSLALLELNADTTSRTNMFNRYHGAVARGEADGIMFRTPASDANGEDVGRKYAAIRRLADRAGKVGRRLRGAIVTPLLSADGDKAVLSCTLHETGRRAYLLLHNTSDTRFVRTPVRISGEGIQAARRVVEVPFDPHTLVGDVHNVRVGQVTLPTNLAPGDAKLFEVFW